MKEIVKIEIEDYSKCNNIWNMKKNPYTEIFINQMKKGTRFVYVYKINDEFVAEGNLVAENEDMDYFVPKQRIYLSHLIVKKEYRNQGIGGEMLSFLLKTAVHMGYAEAALGVDCNNYNAVHLYKNKGFQILLKDKDEYGEFYKMVKKL